MLTEPDLNPSLAEDPGADFEIDSFGGRNPVTKRIKVRENKKLFVSSEEESFNDTFQDTPKNRERRLKECMREATMNNQAQFSRGVPTNDKTSSKNYDSKKLIDGEHKSLMVLGRINEAMEEDDHTAHIYEHRLMLSDPKLSETRRAAIMEHITDHVKKNGKKLKAIDAAKKKEDRPDITKNRGYGHGVGMLSKSLPAKTNSMIPQDDPQSAVRKRTAGVVSMESRIRSFGNAIKVRNRRSF